MTIRVKQGLLTLAFGSAMVVAPLAYSTVVMPAVGHADDGCTATSTRDECGYRERNVNAQGVACADGTVRDDETGQCIDDVEGLNKQLALLPPPPLPGAGGGGGGGLPGLPGLGGIPSLPLANVDLPDVVLPSLGVNLVPNLAINPSFPIVLPTPAQLGINTNPLGLPPPPF